MPVTAPGRGVAAAVPVKGSSDIGSSSDADQQSLLSRIIPPRLQSMRPTTRTAMLMTVVALQAEI
jgi:hypothetical protein